MRYAEGFHDGQMDNFSASLAPCAENSPRAVTRSFDLRLKKWLSKQSRRCWFETPLRSSWRHCNGFLLFCSGSFISTLWIRVINLPIFAGVANWHLDNSTITTAKAKYSKMISIWSTYQQKAQQNANLEYNSKGVRKYQDKDINMNVKEDISIRHGIIKNDYDISRVRINARIK